MRCSHVFRCVVGWQLGWLLAAACAYGEEPSGTWAFVSPQYVLTAEIAGKRSFVLNIVNLSDFVIVVQPNEFIYRGTSGRFYIGQVFDQERKDTKGETVRYSASVLVRGRSFTGLNILGAFRELDQVEELSLRIGARRYYLSPLDRVHFDQLANKVGDLDLTNPSARLSLEGADLTEMGTVKSTDGTSEWDRDWEGLVSPAGEVPPKIIERPEIPLTEEARKAKIQGRVRVFATITKNGNLLDPKVEKGVGYGMDERVLQAVRNSWVFLPATRNGEVLESTVRFDVDIQPTAQSPRP